MSESADDNINQTSGNKNIETKEKNDFFMNSFKRLGLILSVLITFWVASYLINSIVSMWTKDECNCTQITERLDQLNKKLDNPEKPAVHTHANLVAEPADKSLHLHNQPSISITCNNEPVSVPTKMPISTASSAPKKAPCPAVKTDDAVSNITGKLP